MCGIAGFLDLRRSSNDSELTTLATRMADAIRHRGPDRGGAWTDAASGVALGHRRLSIIDLSDAGLQPMASPRGRYVIAFNGEIYNYRELRAELEGSGERLGLKGSSDTEVMLAAFDRWGIDAALPKLNGMFAIAVWDRETRSLTLARDRFGEKPVYYGWVGDTFLFGSELRALSAHPAFSGEIDRSSLALLIRHVYLPEPYCIYRGVTKLPPAGLLTISADAAPGARPEPRLYWSAKQAAHAGLSQAQRLPDNEAVDRLDTLLADAVRMRMVADVPLGGFLSGGIDSSLIIGLMQRASSRPVKTFTIGFREAAYDEAPFAARIAKHLGCEHTELYVTAEETMRVVPELPTLYDEPFADSSQIPTYLVSKLARQHVTVSLSGDAGDELFGGYTRYREADALWNKIAWLPVPARQALASALAAVPRGEWESAFERLSKIKNPSGKADKLARMLSFRTPDEFFAMFSSEWPDDVDLVQGAERLATPLTRTDDWAVSPRFFERMMFLDLIQYLPGDILVKVDRASMAVALESRVPLLDPRIADFSWSLPLDLKVRDGQGKWILRRVLDKYVPREMVERPKTGFGIPIHEWLRGPLRGWAEDLLDESRLRDGGYFHTAPIRERWTQHVAGTHNWAYSLWPVLMFQSWLAAR